MTKLVLGFAQWGSAEVPIVKMIETVQLAVQNGIYEIDCAPHYGDGAQENVLGVALLSLPTSVGSQVKISTKAGRVIDPNKKSESSNGFTNSSGFAQVFDYSKLGIETSFKQSQLRMRQSSVHALYLHDIDKGTHGANHSKHYETFVQDGHIAFDTLKKQNKIEVAGIGSNDPEVCVKLIKDGRFKIDRIMIAGCYNLLNFSALDELFPLCKEKNIQLYVAAPYGGGLLSGQKGNTYFRYEKASRDLLDRVAKIQEICDKFNVNLAHAAMQFVYMHPQVDKVVVGARTPDELRESLKYAREPIAPQFWKALKEAKLIPESTEIPKITPKSGLSLFANSGEDPYESKGSNQNFRI
ncbi:TPA: aldo/keto reductase [Legionella pneumophila]|nr:aldo/keto reductase [Legionella pneumophila]HEM6992009.1 aldo/keto reductase [Legionella pneumophila]HEM7051925.1 aldo/keto reductase [Legionella pneumophila]HEM7061451.1 aldo/keto reductase [Legionella pneumophila]HEM7077479.1 aldo/keto reductase [Legionella pneumophila]